MNCPTCNTIINEKAIENVNVNQCNNCEGIWIQEKKLIDLKDNINNDFNWMDFSFLKNKTKLKILETKNNCPNCSNPMDVLEYGEANVDLDYCINCNGLWIEKRELENIVNALESELTGKSVKGYASATIKEAKNLLKNPNTFITEWDEFATLVKLMQNRILSLHPYIFNGYLFLRKLI